MSDGLFVKHQQRNYSSGRKRGLKRCNSLRHFAPEMKVINDFWNLRHRIVADIPMELECIRPAKSTITTE